MYGIYLTHSCEQCQLLIDSWRKKRCAVGRLTSAPILPVPVRAPKHSFSGYHTLTLRRFTQKEEWCKVSGIFNGKNAFALALVLFILLVIVGESDD